MFRTFPFSYRRADCVRIYAVSHRCARLGALLRRTRIGIAIVQVRAPRNPPAGSPPMVVKAARVDGRGAHGEGGVAMPLGVRIPGVIERPLVSMAAR
jgi:hypothetical protein